MVSVFFLFFMGGKPEGYDSLQHSETALPNNPILPLCIIDFWLYRIVRCPPSVSVLPYRYGTAVMLVDTKHGCLSSWYRFDTRTSNYDIPIGRPVTASIVRDRRIRSQFETLPTYNIQLRNHTFQIPPFFFSRTSFGPGS